MSAEAYYRGFKVIAVWSDECGELESHIPHEVAAIGDLYVAEIRYPDDAPTLEALAAKIEEAAREVNATWEHIIAGGESGVKICENLGSKLGMRGNSTAGGFENRGTATSSRPASARSSRTWRSGSSRGITATSTRTSSTRGTRTM